MKEVCVSDGYSERYSDDLSKLVARDVGSNTFWSGLKALRKHLKPLKTFIRLTDSDCHTTEHVYPGMVQVEEHWSENSANVPAPYRTFSLKVHSPTLVHSLSHLFMYIGTQRTLRMDVVPHTLRHLRLLSQVPQR